MSIKAIIIAAGMGTRLRPHTDDKPKCMVTVGKKSILQHQHDALARAGVEEFVIIKGYKQDKVVAPGFSSYINSDFKNNQVLESLFYAAQQLSGEVIICYGDIIYPASFISKLIKTKGDIKPVIDLNWAANYLNRDQNPFTDAELSTGNQDKITAIGKSVADKWNCRGEFTGIVYLSAKGVKNFKDLYYELKAQYESGERINLIDVPFRKAYVTHLLQEMVIRGYELTPVEVNEDWVEIDTDYDYQKALRLFG